MLQLDKWNISRLITVRHFDYLFWGIESICAADTILSLLCANKTYFYQCLLDSIIFKVEKLAVIQVNGRRNVDFIVISAAEITLSFSSFSVTVVDTKNKMADASSPSSPYPPTE